MKKTLTMVMMLVMASMMTIAQEYKAEGDKNFHKPSLHTLWYDQPAGTTYKDWQEYSLPIGNGELGASVFGALKQDKITLNEKSLWAGNSVTRPNPEHGEYLKLGNLWVTDLGSVQAKGVKEYARWLDIDHGLAGVKYLDQDGTLYTRMFIASQPDKVVAARYTAEGDNTLHLRFALEPGAPLVKLSPVKPQVRYAGNTASYSGKLELLSYAAQMSVSTDKGGRVRSTQEGIEVEGAHEILVVMTAATDYDGSNNVTFTSGEAIHLVGDMANRVHMAQRKGWDRLARDHVADFTRYMGRTELALAVRGKRAESQRNMVDLIENYSSSQQFRDSQEGLYLEELYYSYGRYLLISSNRGMDVPNNLQGLWIDTDKGHAPWNSDIHTNINIQMNYWPAEANGLGELHLPLLNYIVNIAQSPGCLNQAKRAGQSVGWVINTESNLFGGMSSWSDNYTIANAWYATHLWWHYRYSLDKDYLARVFPAMWSAAQYWAERLVKAEDGTYECPKEFSPEHGPQRENATAHSQQLVRELFDNTLAAIEALGNESTLDAEWLARIRDRRAHLDLGLHIEKYEAVKGWNTLIPNGAPLLREWKYSPYTAGQCAHRHTSHLMALYPFSQIKPGDEYFQAAVNSLTQRTDESTGWAMGWRVNLWARALDGNHARTMINHALLHAGHEMNYSSGGIYYNLWDAHTPFQIDGNFGVAAGISEMLMQSYDGVIRLLPALPSVWSEGSVRGLCAEGNFTVDMSWKKGRLVSATITSNKGSDLTVIVGKKTRTMKTTPGQVITIRG